MKKVYHESGIYKITNIKTDDYYIGSAVDITNRWYRHKKDLRKNKHHSIILLRAWIKYGENSFQFSVLENCGIDELESKENFYIKKLKPIYNICPIAYSQVGRKLSEEHKNKLKKYAILNNIRPPKETYEKKQKAVIMLDKIRGNHLKNFKSLSDACRYVGRDHRSVSSLSECCNGKRKTLYGYKWIWDEEKSM